VIGRSRIGIALSAIPVIALVYAGQLRRGRVAVRLGLLAGTGAIVLAGLAGFGVSGAVARPAGERPTYADLDFRPVVLTTTMTGSSPVAAGSVGSVDGDRGGSDEPGAADEPAAADEPDYGLPLSREVLEQATVAPSVVRFRPRDGWTDVERDAWLSVRFTMPMHRRSTAAAFHAVVDGKEIDGRTWWAEGDTVFVLDPRDPLPAGATVRLRVDDDATSSAGIALETPSAATFTTVKPAPQPTRSVVTARAPAPAQPPASSSTSWIWPLIGPITQRFGQELTQYGPHMGIDIDGDTGDPVKAARTGTVTVAGYADSCGGIQVRIDHGDGFVSHYHHFSAELVSVGQRVARGTIIGRVGSTGCSTGSHLHFAITKNGVWVDPERYLP
jgi:murein DD-endopeptidase MepM/ murein hydrolase activator NlpD